ncbi:hypothetical protein PAAG_01379 [Paracoccidioides lutzii Pb01]|uniref:Uncharacterized protein n=1 Tax=Paracoccidioides lutzii (strain ATCC MYA-826 / Pb01) TaxID=502779 RepID=C1GS84_PARBA|nr:hypothetical protein PAAG_01379 [Paracoccidioides lutzii Pb01]EEH38917.2 hypothetical protein PAAG_01379 [Paracoccidioides lutzii Pb01]
MGQPNHESRCLGSVIVDRLRSPRSRQNTTIPSFLALAWVACVPLVGHFYCAVLLKRPRNHPASATLTLWRQHGEHLHGPKAPYKMIHMEILGYYQALGGSCSHESAPYALSRGVKVNPHAELRDSRAQSLGCPLEANMYYFKGSSGVDFEVLGLIFAGSLRNRRPSVQGKSYAEIKVFDHGMVTLRSSCWDSQIVNPGPISAAP